MTRSSYFTSRLTAAVSALMLSVVALTGSVVVPADAHAAPLSVSNAA